jgi:hypothetical protein
MAPVIRGTVFLVAILATAFVYSDEPKPVEIPLKDIWAFDMPDATDVRELEPDAYGHTDLTPQERDRRFKNSLVEGISRSLIVKPASDDQKSGFVVRGTGHEALQEANDVLTKKKKPDSIFPADSELSIIFFVRLSGPDCLIDRIERTDKQFSIDYHLSWHIERNLSHQFVIIPIGKLTAGKYEVSIQQPNASTDADREVDQRSVCKSFSFEVK